MSAQNGRWKDRMSQSDLDAVNRGIPAIAPRGKGSHETLRWREPDSNSWSHRKREAVRRSGTMLALKEASGVGDNPQIAAEGAGDEHRGAQDAVVERARVTELADPREVRLV